ncbi:MAG: PAS domain S-box protein [Pseudomonadota bacterium]
MKIRLRIKFIIGVYLLTITILGVLLFFTYNEALFLIKEQFNNQQLFVATQTAGGIEKTIKSYVKTLEYIGTTTSGKTLTREESRSFLAQTFEFIKTAYVKDLILLDADGSVKVSLMEPQSEGSNHSKSDYFIKAKAAKKSAIIFEFITFTGIDLGRKGIIVANPLYSPGGEFNGVVFLIVKINELISSYIPFELKNSNSCVISSGGEILCNPRELSGEAIKAKNLNDASFGPFFAEINTGKVFSGEYISPSGLKAIAGSYPIRIADETWSMVIATPVDVFRNLLAPLSIKFAVVSLVALLALVGVSVFLINLISKWNYELDAMVKVRTDELSRSEEKFRVMMETINELIWETDAERKYTYVSPMVSKILGYQPEEMIGTTLFDLMAEEDARKLRKVLEEIEKSRKPFNGLQRVYTHKNGLQIILETNGAPILDEMGILKGFRGADRDITQRKKAEEVLQKYAVYLEDSRNSLEQKVGERTAELNKAHEALVRKEKLAVLGQLSASVSHELRNPLGVIKNAVYFFNMKIDSFDDPAVRENIKIITREIDTANKIITGLLDFTRDKSPVRLDININQLVTEMLSKCVIPDNVSIKTEFAQNLNPAGIDPTQVAQVFINLIENAIQSMEQGGTLTVKTRSTAGGTEIVFADQGYGISTVNLDRIFEPLFTTKTKGIGLGLAISKSMIEANGGTISVESVEGKGSAFTLLFPHKR